MPTFEEQAVSLWTSYVEQSNVPNLKDEELLELQDQYDEDYEALMLAFSHPPGKPKRPR
jgi:hypothetical protein